MKRLRDERAAIFAISAVAIPVFLILTALVLDVGRWYTHKRALQNRADAGALAAGYEYLSQLQHCPSSTAEAAIRDAARLYAGAGPGDYNETVNDQSQVSVQVSDPCQPHDGDRIWTDVTVRESNIGTIAGAFGVNLSSITARARVELNQLSGTTPHSALPFVLESGDYVQCVWAEFVQADDPTVRVNLVGVSNPVTLTKDPIVPRRWTADVPGIDIGASTKDIGVVYWMGIKTGGACNFNTQQKGILPGDDSGNPVPIDRINVYEDDLPAADEAPMLKHFTLTPGTCGPDRVGFIYAASACTITFTAEVASGSNPMPSTIIVDDSNPNVSSVPVTGSGPKYTGQITLDPNQVTGANVSGDYTQVGQHRFKVRWEQTAGKVGAKNCTPGNPCTGTFLSDESPNGSNVQQSTYVADPVNSTPLFSAELLSGGSPLQNSWAGAGPDTGPFTIVVTNTGVDKDHIVLIRRAAQGPGNRSLTVDCGQGGAGNIGLALQNGCPKQLVVNQRNDACPGPLPDGSWDCVQATSETAASVQAGLTDRFASPCTQNNWVNGSSPDNLNADDSRFAYVPLTALGRLRDTSGRYPIKAIARVYVTGGDGLGCPGDDPPPRGHSAGGGELWGHLVDVVTLKADVIPGQTSCDLKVSILNCKPTLVR